MNNENELSNTNDKELAIFENKKIRKVVHNDEWYFSIVDIIEILTESKDPTAYWRKLKQRLHFEGNESVTNCHGLKMIAQDDKMRLTDCANRETVFRII